MFLHPFGLFILLILLGGVVLFVVMSIELCKLFSGGDPDSDSGDVAGPL